MKLTNLSLAILVAVGVAACGGSDDNNSNRPVDPKTPSTPDNNNNNNNNNNQANEQQHVDPTGTKVVDNKDLSEVSTVGTLQYIRREGSQYDRANNPSKPASASPLLGVTLNEQNPSLTNIVLARQELVRADGQPVKAQFAGSSNPEPLVARTGEFQLDSQNKVSLQQENFENVDILAGLYQPRATGNQTTNNTESGKISRTVVTDDTSYNAYHAPYVTKDKTNDAFKTRIVVAVSNDPQTSAANNYLAKHNSPSGNTVHKGDAVTVGYRKADMNAGTIATDGTYAEAGKGPSAIIDAAPYKLVADETNGILANAGKALDKNDRDIYTYRGVTKEGTKTIRTTTTWEYANDSNTASATRYGKGLVWWSTPETAFENEFTRRGAKKIDPTKLDDMQKAVADATTGSIEGRSSAATNGLIRVGGGLSTLGEETKKNPSTGKWEDHHNTTTRIFGRYHLAYADTNAKTINPVSLNSYSGARTFVAEYETDNPNKATEYSLGAKPITLTRVQYGRVSNNLDLDAGQTGYADNFMRSDFVHKNNDGGVDNYFYRGTDATSIEQMAALPSNQSAVYNGHALMYGIDNDYHGSTGKSGRDLPNAFAPSGAARQALGMGNFVEARVDFNKKRVEGEVYNTWLLDPAKNVTTKDRLVRFAGAITGNTVVGAADRVYADGDDDATFKASFFGDKAQEMGGSFNSVKDDNKYGDAYGANDWGGVFGATRGETNTFQGDDGAKTYTNKYGD